MAPFPGRGRYRGKFLSMKGRIKVSEGKKGIGGRYLASVAEPYNVVK